MPPGIAVPRPARLIELRWRLELLGFTPGRPARTSSVLTGGPEIHIQTRCPDAGEAFQLLAQVGRHRAPGALAAAGVVARSVRCPCSSPPTVIAVDLDVGACRPSRKMLCRSPSHKKQRPVPRSVGTHQMRGITSLASPHQVAQLPRLSQFSFLDQVIALLDGQN